SPVTSVGQTFLSAGGDDFPVVAHCAGLESPLDRQTRMSALRQRSYADGYYTDDGDGLFAAASNVVSTDIPLDRISPKGRPIRQALTCPRLELRQLKQIPLDLTSKFRSRAIAT